LFKLKRAKCSFENPTELKYVGTRIYFF